MTHTGNNNHIHIIESCINELSTHDYALCFSNHIQHASQVAVSDTDNDTDDMQFRANVRRRTLCLWLLLLESIVV